MKFLLADDHILFREGMKLILQNMYPGVEIFEASNSTEVFKFVESRIDINLILLDLQMPDIDGISAMNRILCLSPTTVIVILTASERLVDMRLALSSGAMGYISKSLPPNIMKSALQLVLSGGVYVPAAMISNYESLVEKEDRQISLTPRQTQILKLIVDGHSNKLVARKLGLTEATVKTHVSTIFKVLNVKNRTQAAMKAQTLELDSIN